MVMVFKTDFRGVIDPAETLLERSMTPLKFKYYCFLCEYNAMYETALDRELGPYVELIDEKNHLISSHDTVPLRCKLTLKSRL
jgi:hypothetical protein